MKIKYTRPWKNINAKITPKLKRSMHRVNMETQHTRPCKLPIYYCKDHTQTQTLHALSQYGDSAYSPSKIANHKDQIQPVDMRDDTTGLRATPIS